MLSVGKLSVGQERYYLEQAEDRVDFADSVGAGIEDYYADPLEARGRWAGVSAEPLGLRGPVGPDALRQLLVGIHPTTGEPLRDGQPLKVAAYDLTFSAPKSVSLLFGLSDATVTGEVRAGHDVAVGQALGYLERSAAAVRRGHGGEEVLPAKGLVAAVFRHRTSRAGDPQLHSHTVVANLGLGPDSRWTALDGRQLYRHATTASYVYQAVLRGELTRRLGVAWEPITDGIAELRGISSAARSEFSRRRADIEAELERTHAAGPRAAEIAALTTRQRKQPVVDRSALVAEWRDRAAAVGLTATRLVTLLDRTTPPDLASVQVAVLRDWMLSADGLTRDRSTFDRGDVIRAICGALPPGADVDVASIERQADEFLGGPSVVPVAERGDGPAGAVSYSTPELLNAERRLIELAHRPPGIAGVADPSAVETALAARPSLSDEQRRMVRAVTLGGARISAVAGRAGTGKTYALAAAHDAWRESGVPVAGVAVARRAARELQDGSGIPSTSVTALLSALDRGATLPPHLVLVVDEAGMVGTRQLSSLVDVVNDIDGKVVLVGDHRQLPALQAGGAFRGIVYRGLATELTENRRQIHEWERTAVEHLRNGRGEAALSLYEQHGRLSIEATQDDARARLVEDWWRQSGGDGVMVAQQRRDVADLNFRARERMREDGRLGEDEIRTAGGRVSAGDLVVIRVNDPDRSMQR